MMVGGGEGGERTPTVAVLPQYAHLATVSPGFSPTGAPQLGHLSGL